MEHQEALNTMATERYLLDEMAEPERGAFEEHFFSCHECAADIRAGGAMMRAGARVAQEPLPFPKPDPKPGWTAWMPQAAAAAILAGLGGWFGALQTVTPQVAAVPAISTIAQVDFHMSESRGPGEETMRIPAGRLVSLNVYIPSNDDAASYLLRVRGAGKADLSFPVSREQAETPYSLVLPRELPRGSYEVVIEGVRKEGNRFPIARSPFVVGER